MYRSLLPTQSTTVISRQLSNIPTQWLLSKCKNNLILLTDQLKSPKKTIKALSWNYWGLKLMLVSASIDKDVVAPNCVNNVRHIVVAFSDVRNVFDVIQLCEYGGRTKYCRFDIST